jgi:release factor glutamine methyltransferase
MVGRRAEGVPLEQVVGWAQLCGVRVAVAPGVFVPRARTELLVRRAAALGGPGAVVVDLCCGSGAVGAALAAILDVAELHAVDIDPAAVACARRNVSAAGGHVHQGDLYAPLPPGLRGRVDLLVANAPYVPTEAIGLLPAEARVHEPRAALDGGPDGLDVVRRVAAGAPPWLAPDGHLLVETSRGQAAHALGTVTAAGLVARVVHSSELDATVVVGTKPAPA